MGRFYRFALCGLLTTGCRFLTDPCAPETRYVAHVQSWNVVCLAPQDDGLQMCAVWPTPPPAPDWVGNPAAQTDSGYPLRAVVVCKDASITDTPI